MWKGRVKCKKQLHGDKGHILKKKKLEKNLNVYYTNKVLLILSGQSKQRAKWDNHSNAFLVTGCQIVC